MRISFVGETVRDNAKNFSYNGSIFTVTCEKDYDELRCKRVERGMLALDQRKRKTTVAVHVCAAAAFIFDKPCCLWTRMIDFESTPNQCSEKIYILL
ncbi:unnamed protein product [Dovyalis caffra]|uniref:Uncharacterized protein n=1 Tax=Dovyalis caffra TaxID=77055 RepID=A0AAV1SP29_9ROSI|nr:unnamed protein product [Dovyalis caffra]